MDENNNITLGEIDNGNVVLQVNEYLKQLVADIADPNKKATKPRSVNLSITFAPSKSRREAEVSYNVSLKPGPHVEREKSVIYIGKAKDGTPIAKPYVPNQPVIPGVEDAFNAKEDDEQLN